MRIAAIQHDIVWEDSVATCRHVEPMVAGAVASGAGLVVLTEMFATGFSMEAERIAEPEGGPTSMWIQEQAASHGVWLYGSVAERPAAGGKPRNVGVLAHAQGVRRILLVTSAVHMPRASLLFRRNGMEVFEVPVPEPTLGGTWADQWIPSGRALWRSGRALKEYAGLVALCLGADKPA